MVDGRGLMGYMPDMDRFHFTEAFTLRYFEEQKAGKIAPVRFAFLGFHPFVDPDKEGEKVAIDLGLTVKVTVDATKAFDWLMVKSAKE